MAELWLQVHAEASTPAPATNVASDSLRKSPKQRGIAMPKLPPSKPNLEQGIKIKADIMRAMIKRQLETVEDARHHIGRRKRARVQNSEPPCTPSLLDVSSCSALKRSLLQVTAECDTIKNLFDQLASSVKSPLGASTNGGSSPREMNTEE